jgi:hypothetical protein
MSKETKSTERNYKGLPKILYGVRWTQHLLAIIAEILILVSFAMSGMDVSLSGVMTGIVWLKWAWGAAFALGIDTSFVIAWVRVRQGVINRKWGSLVWNITLAVGMSFIVFQPVAIQLLQQSLGISFEQALYELGINIVILVYARAIVAVLLGAILAMTNVETGLSEQVSTVFSVQKPKRRIAILDKALNKIAPVVDTLDMSSSVQASSVSVQEIDPLDTTSVHTEQVHSAQPVQIDRPTVKRPTTLTPVLTPIERVRQAMDNEPGISDRRLASILDMSPTTIGKYRKMIDAGHREAM